MVNNTNSQAKNGKPLHKVLATAFTFGAALVFLQTTGQADTVQNAQTGSAATNVATTTNNTNNYIAAAAYNLGATSTNSYVSTYTANSNYGVDSSYNTASQTEQNSNNQTNASQTAQPESASSTATSSINVSGLSTSNQQFLASIKQGAINGWKQYGVLPSVTAAQAIIESGWGQSALATQGHNLFGIKGSYNGQSITMRTAEYGSGGYYYINAAFRKYSNNSESVVDHGRFLASNSRYSNLLWQKDYRVVTRDLQSDGYATSPTYASTLNSVIQRYNLTAWDQEAFGTNTGWIDSVAADGNNLKISGWHATDNYSTSMHHYIIILNADTKQELYRTEVAGVYRQDVQNVYGNATISGWGGFSLTVPLSSLKGAANLQIVSRYTLDKTGNPNGGADIYFTPVKNNAGFLDSFTVKNNRIYVSGWNANNATSAYKNHFIILYDVTKGKEVGRKLVGNTTRNDVARAGYSGIDNASQSGFQTSFNITADMAGDTFEIVSRYSDSSNINSYGHYSDLWYGSKELTLNQKQGWLDNFTLSGNKVTVSGWHADDMMAKYGTHTLILYDRTLGREIARTTVTNQASNDVAKAYPQIYGSNDSRFSATFTIDSKYVNDNLQLISRYSTASGVNNSSQYSDIWFDKQITR